MPRVENLTGNPQCDERNDVEQKDANFVNRHSDVIQRVELLDGKPKLL